MKEENIKLYFGGQTHRIDANTVVNTLIHYQNIIQIINQELGEGNYNIEVKIESIEQGSFIINTVLMGNVIKNIFSKDRIDYVSTLIKTVKDFCDLYKQRKGKPIKETEKEKYGVYIESLNIYNTPTTREAFSKIIETCKNDPSVESFNIKDNDGEITSFKQEQFDEYIYDDFANEDIPIRRNITDDKAIVNILTLSFEKSVKWSVMYQGNKIPVTIKDDIFRKMIDDGETFAKGDSLAVKLEISQQYNKEYNAYENKSYRIIEVIKHYQRPIQKEVFTN